MWSILCTGGQEFISKVLCLFCFENHTTEGRGGAKGKQIAKQSTRTETLTLQIPIPLYYKLQILTFLGLTCVYLITTTLHGFFIVIFWNHFDTNIHCY